MAIPTNEQFCIIDHQIGQGLIFGVHCTKCKKIFAHGSFTIEGVGGAEDEAPFLGYHSFCSHCGETQAVPFVFDTLDDARALCQLIDEVKEFKCLLIGRWAKEVCHFDPGAGFHLPPTKERMH